MAKISNSSKYQDQELIRLISNEVLGVDGVCELNSKKTMVFNMLLKDDNSQNSGIKLIRIDKGVKIEVHINVYYGSNIPQLCYEIQQKVKNRLENENNTKVISVDISVDGVITRY